MSTQYELCWQLGIAHPDHLSERLNRQQLAGWLAWLERRPRGARHLEAVMAHQTSALYSAWVEGEHPPSKFMPKWKDVIEAAGPKSEADHLFEEFGRTERMVQLDAG